MLLKFKCDYVTILNNDFTNLDYVANCYNKTVLVLEEKQFIPEEKLYKVLYNGSIFWTSELNFYATEQKFFEIKHEDDKYTFMFPCPPGESLIDWMQESNYFKDFLMEKLNMSLEELNIFLLGHKLIDDELANKLSEITEVSKSFWIARERLYRKELKNIIDENRAQKKNK